MGWLEHYFNLEGETGEHRVCCPLDHYTENGLAYKETNASASVNLDKRLFHCSSCDRGYTEQQLLQKILDCTFANACRLVTLFNNNETRLEWASSTQLDQNGRDVCTHFGIDLGTAAQLNIASVPDAPEQIMFPVFYEGHLIDIRRYRPNQTPKMLSRKGSPSGLVIPYDLWRASDKITIICAGEKDMATTRSHNLNAITITGGELMSPLSREWFRDRKVVIAYDNDDAGRKGANKLATELYQVCKEVKILTKFHEVCKEDKEDLTDYWNKYNGTREDLIKMIIETEPFVAPAVDTTNKNIPTRTLSECSEIDNVGKLAQSEVQIVGTYDQQFIIPTSFIVEKIKEEGNDRMLEGEVREWELNDDNLRDMLLLCDNSIDDSKRRSNMLFMAGVHPSEKGVKITELTRATVTKATISDVPNFTSDDVPVEFTAYVIGAKVESGKKYSVTHALVTHPTKGQQLHSIITAVTPSMDVATRFELTDEVKANLDLVKNMEGTVAERINTLAEKVKGLLGYNGNSQLITTIDLAFHTVLEFNFGAFKGVRGYLDTLIVGESRVGKSSTADCLRKTYGLGAFVSLAGNSATIPALVGGTNKQANGQGCTKAGVIPQNHKGLIIFEEFGKCDKNITAELTDIRSSNEVRVQRVSGSLTLPAMVRMISLSNVKPTANGDIRPIESYPNGIAVATELVPTAEDIARYDMLLISADKGNAFIDPLWQPATPFPTEVYRDKIRWVWSRTADDVVFEDEAAQCVVQFSNDLNSRYDCHIKIFGTECWKKLCRLSIAVAGYLASTDETYTKIVVKREHVAFAANFMRDLYVNDTFRLKEYVANERKYLEIDEAGVSVLQEMFIGCPQLLLFLDENAQATKQDLDTVIGLSKDESTGFQSRLVRGAFITLHGSTWIPTTRFRKGMKLINRDCSLKKLGEV